MRLLVMHDKPRGELGGMNAFIAAQNALFTGAGWCVSELICTQQPQPGSLHLAPSGRRLGRRALKPLHEMLDALQPDAVLLHSVYYALGPWALAALERRVPVIYLMHDVTPLCPRLTRLTRDGRPCSRPQGAGCVGSGCFRIGEHGGWASDAHGLLMRWLQMGVARTVRQWVVPSRYLAELLQLHGVAPARVALVPHFIEPAPSALDRPVPGRLLYAGRLVKEKGVRVLMDALARLHARHWTLHVAGDGPEREALEAVVQQRGWAGRVRWCGSLSPGALTMEYAEAAVVVMPSLMPESFGLVGLETMRQGRPVAGFASGGMTEWLRDGVNGRIAAWGDPAALALALDDLLAHPEAAQVLGRRGREIVSHEFGAAVHLRRMQQLIEQCIARHGATALPTVAGVRP